MKSAENIGRQATMQSDYSVRRKLNLGSMLTNDNFHAFQGGKAGLTRPSRVFLAMNKTGKIVFSKRRLSQ